MSDLLTHVGGRPVRWTVPKPEHGSPEWLALRLPYANASTAAVHVREHEYESAADWWVEKVTGIGKEQTAPMERGQALEEAILQWYERRLGVQIVTPDVMYGYGRLLATPDGHVVGSRVGVEAKATFRPGSRSRWWQCQAVMLACDWDEMHLVELDERDLKPTIIQRDEKECARLYEAIEADMAYVDLETLPADAELSERNVKALHPKHAAGLAVELDDDDVRMVGQLAKARLAMKEAEALEQAAKDHLARKLGAAELGRYKGKDAITWRTNKPSSKLDAVSLMTAEPDLVKKYLKTVEGNRVMKPVKS